jgi:hypothetical protein
MKKFFFNIYNYSEWIRTSPPRPHAFCSSPLQASIFPFDDSVLIKLVDNIKRLIAYIYRYFRGIVINVIIIKTIKYFDIAKNILYSIGINPTEYLEDLLAGIISLTFFLFTGKILKFIRFRLLARKLIWSVPMLVKSPLNSSIDDLTTTAYGIYKINDERDMRFKLGIRTGPGIMIIPTPESLEYHDKLRLYIQSILEKRGLPENKSILIARWLAQRHLWESYHVKRRNKWWWR